MIRKAFIESLAILGPAVIDSIIGELDDMGISLGRKCASLAKIAEGLRYIYGEETAEMMMQRIFIKLDELHWNAAAITTTAITAASKKD
jgi:hypothetical protein